MSRHSAQLVGWGPTATSKCLECQVLGKAGSKQRAGDHAKARGRLAAERGGDDMSLTG